MARRGTAGLGRVRAQHREEEGPNRWGPPVGGCERGGEADLDKRGNGPSVRNGPGERKRKKRKRKREWAGLKEIGKEREVSIFLFQQKDSNNSIQI